jgi:hypothetical protein
VTFRRHQAIPSSTLMAEWRLLRALTYMAALREFRRCHLIPNLPGSVPSRRPYCSSDATLFGYFAPSGSVPGGGGASRAWKQRREHGGRGLDCFSKFSFEVLAANCEAYVVISYFQMCPYVKCNATAINY